MSHSGQSAGSGSVSNTSSAAPPRWPSCRADTRSSVPARLPRPTLTSTAPAFIACRRSAVSRPAVSRVFGRQPMTMSARGSRASNASSVCASSKSAGTAETAVRFTPSTAAPKTFNRRATFAPMSPMPSTSAVLPEIVSAWSYFCQICACLLLQYRPNERYSATRLPIAYSAMIVPNAPDAFASTTLRGRFSMRVYLSAPAQVNCSRRRFSVCASWASLGSPKITAAARSCSRVFAVLRERERAPRTESGI